MKVIHLTIVILYLLLCLGIGYWAYRKVSGRTSEYWAAGGKISTFTNAWAMLATLASAGSIMAAAGTGYNLGVSYGASLTGGAIVGFALCSVLVAKQMRNSNSVTVPDFLNKRYGNKVIDLIVPIAVIITMSGYMVAQLKAGGLVASYILGIPYSTGVIISTLVFVFYVSIGGMWAITYTDLLQGVLKASVVWALGIIILCVVGFNNFMGEVSVKHPQYGAINLALPYSSYIGGFITWAFAACVSPHLVMRVFTAENAKSARLSLNWAMVLYALVMITSSIVLSPALVTLPAETLKSVPSDAVFLALADRYFPPVLSGIVVAGVLAGIMSTSAGLLLATSGAFAHDLYAKFINPNAPEKKIIRVGSVTTWIVGLIVLLFALNPPEYLVVLYTAAIGFLVSTLFGPIVLGIWWKNATSSGALAGVIAGALSYLFLFLGLKMPASTQILVALPVSLVFMIVVSLFTKESTDKKEFVEKIHLGA